MGVLWFDLYTIWHLIIGLISHIIANSTTKNIIANFIICNGTHLIIEFIENNRDPSGRMLESSINHLSDVVAFLVGWLISFILNLKASGVFLKFLWSITMMIFIKEVFREVYPYSRFGAFR